MRMRVTIDLPPDVEARVQEEAAKRSLPVEALLVHLVSDAFPTHGEAKQHERSLSILRSVRDLGSEAEQQETFTYLKRAVEADRLSNRKRFS